MPSNVEIKARVSDMARLQRLAEALSQGPPTVLNQEDIFFLARSGRLKLRTFSPQQGELIFYDRPNNTGIKESYYIISKTDNPHMLKEALAAALGISVIVTKRRLLYLVGQTRIHLDEVHDLGTFMELEVVLRPGQSAEEGYRIAKELMQKLEIADSQLISGAYADLLAEKELKTSARQSSFK